MRLVEFLTEENNTQLARHYTDVLNTRYRPEGIPLKITTHLVDQINNTRNSPPINLGEIVDFFSKLLLKKKKILQELPDGSSLQVVDLESDIHIPFIKSQGILVAATIMRGEMRRSAQRKVAI